MWNGVGGYLHAPLQTDGESKVVMRVLQYLQCGTYSCFWTTTGFADRTLSSTYLDETTVNGDVSPTDEEPIVRDLDQ